MSASMVLKAKATRYNCPKCGAPLWEMFNEEGRVDSYHCYRLSGERHSFTQRS